MGAWQDAWKFREQLLKKSRWQSPSFGSLARHAVFQVPMGQERRGNEKLWSQDVTVSPYIMFFLTLDVSVPPISFVH